RALEEPFGHVNERVDEKVEPLEVLAERREGARDRRLVARFELGVGRAELRRPSLSLALAGGPVGDADLGAELAEGRGAPVTDAVFPRDAENDAPASFEERRKSGV